MKGDGITDSNACKKISSKEVIRKDLFHQSSVR
jgi:hypothetical protein